MNIYNGYTSAKNKVIFYPPGNENTATPSSTGNSLFIINPDGTILSKVMYLFFLNIWANIFNSGRLPTIMYSWALRLLLPTNT